MVLHEKIEACSIGRALIGLVLLALTIPCAAQAKEPEPAGFVVDARGTWVTVLGNPLGNLHRNSYVYAGQQIQPSQPLAGSFITIALANGKAVRHSCVKEKDIVTCGPLIVIEDLPPVSSTAARIVSAILKLIKPEEEHSAATIARDVFGPQPGVVGIKGGQLDLRPSLERIPEGSYLAVLVPDHPDLPVAGPETSRYPVLVPSAGPVWIKAGALKPSLYHLTILSSSGKELVGTPVLVLVASEADFDSLHRDFAEAQEVISSLDEDMTASSVQDLLTVYLKTLAASGPGKR
jgi:hypothetical protein